MLTERKLTTDELEERDKIIQGMITKDKRSLVRKYGKEAEKVIYGRATNIIKKKSEDSLKTKIGSLLNDILTPNEKI